MRKIVCYTRIADADQFYEEKLAYSMHLALEQSDGTFLPLNHNYGVLFAKGLENPNGSISPGYLKQPCLYRRKDGEIGVIAKVVSEKMEAGEWHCWKTRDLVRYYEVGVFTEEERSELLREERLTDALGKEYPISGFDQGCEFVISEEEAEYLQQKLITPFCKNVYFPESVCLENIMQLEKTKAEIEYSDKTFLSRKIDWNMGSLCDDAKITHMINGKIKQKHFTFPFAAGRADPCIGRWNGHYYFVATNDLDQNHTIYIRESDSIEGLQNAPEHLILDSEMYDEIGNLLWAPELHEIEGRLYIFLAATKQEFFEEASHVMALMEGGNPINKKDWSRPVKVVKADGTQLCEAGKEITLDMTCFQWKQNYYAIWSQRQFLPDDLGAWLYIARLDKREPWKLFTEPCVLSKPEYGWENNHTFVNEGPFALVHDDRLIITFSGGGIDTSYTVGYLELLPDGDPLDKMSWRKNNYPILSSFSVNGEFGTGHNSYICDEGGFVWNVYHARPSAEGERSAGIRLVHFDIDGIPMLDVTEEQDLPNGYENVSTSLQWI